MEKRFKVDPSKVYKVQPEFLNHNGLEIYNLDMFYYDETSAIESNQNLSPFGDWFYFKSQDAYNVAEVSLRPNISAWKIYVVKLGGEVIARLYRDSDKRAWYEVFSKDDPSFLYFAQTVDSSIAGTGPEYLTSKRAVRMNFPIYGAPLDIMGFEVVAMGDFPTDKVKELPEDAVGTSLDAISYYIATDQNRDNAPNWIGWTNRTGLPISQIEDSRLPRGAKDEIAKVHSHEYYYVLGTASLMPNGLPVILTDPIYIDNAFKDGSEDKSQAIYDLMFFHESMVDSVVLYVVKETGREPQPGEVKRSVLKRIY